MKKIAIPTKTDNSIDSHFGHCEQYSIYTISEIRTIEDAQIIKSEQGCGCKSNIAAELSQLGVTLMLAGGIGSGAISVLNRWGIEVVRGCSGNSETAVKEYLLGSILDSGESCLQHELHQSSGHVCNHDE